MSADSTGSSTQRPAIRRATPEDLPALVELAERTFRDTFASDNTLEDLEAYVAKAFAPETLEGELADPASTFLLAFADSEAPPIGYGRLLAGPPTAAVRGQNPVEIVRLYVDQEAIGLGVGAALMQSLFDEARRQGHQTIWLGVWERNARAIAFYRRWGFEEVGTHIFQLGSDRQTDLIFEHSL